MLKNFIGESEFIIHHLDKLGEYKDNDFGFYLTYEDAYESVTTHMKNALNKAASNRLVRKKFKNKTAIISELGKSVNADMYIYNIINRKALELTAEEVYELSEKVKKKEITFQDFKNMAISYTSERFDYLGNHIATYECVLDEYNSNVYIPPIRREISDYNETWDIYNIGDIVKLKRPLIRCYEKNGKIRYDKKDTCIILRNPNTMPEFQDREYNIYWANQYLVVTEDGEYLYEDSLHYEDILERIGNVGPCRIKELLNKYESFSSDMIDKIVQEGL